MFEVRNVRTNETYMVRANMGKAMDDADALRLGTNDDYCVVELKAVYHTADTNYALRPTPMVLSRAASSLIASWERFRALRMKLYPNG